MTMYALATLFDFDLDPALASIWQRLQKKCGLVTANESSFTHLSWQGALDYQIDTVHEILKGIATQSHGFSVNVAGIGIFTGKEPVLYLNVVKNRDLLNLHEVLWRKLGPTAVEMNAYYAPSVWVPHITLAYGTLMPTDLACAVEELM
ncbi:2'-5' RNA ligase family protein, partial [bacterium]